MSAQEELREGLVQYLRAELVGPVEERERLQESPCQRYSAGVLFPRKVRFDPADDLDDRPEDMPATEERQLAEPEGESEDVLPGRGRHRAFDSDLDPDDPVVLANSFLPSALGITFVVTADTDLLDIIPRVATYSTSTEEVTYVTADGPQTRTVRTYDRRVPELAPVTVRLGSGPVNETRGLLSGRLSIAFVVRPQPNGSRVVTVSLYNNQFGRRNSPPEAARCFFQAGFSVRAGDGAEPFLEYSRRRLNPDPEEASLALLYRKRRSFALGHGCAAEWITGSEADRAIELRTETVPAVKIPPVLPHQDPAAGTDMEYLSDAGVESAELSRALSQTIAEYANWISARREESRSLEDDLRTTAGEHLDQCEEAHRRMQTGVRLLSEDVLARRAFRLANRAMLMQQSHFARPRRLPDDAEWLDFPGRYRSAREPQVRGYWRTFQLAFILMNLSAFSEDDQYRDHVDLIWFPTGGGKTEAYLGLTAYSIFLRRLRRPSDGGCTVLMRYTLRLLTAQQFQRASTLICACERIRDQHPRELGNERITIGLWVGSKLTPNKRADAIAALNKMSRGGHDAPNPFQLLSCPWCGTALDSPTKRGYRQVRRPARTVVMRCPELRCPFHSMRTPLPVRIIDEDIYEEPPTLLIGTVDKFAMLAWRPEARTIFGSRNSARVPSPPALIIQDELHLISGPLGSMVGLYESAIDLLCSSGERRPKIVGSTATIRRAREQVGALYDRDVFQFPPPGLDASDSFFAREKPSDPGRVYVGVLPSAASSPATALVRVASPLLQGAKSLPLPQNGEETDRDPYWTLVQYFGSLRELGRASTLVQADIPEHLDIMARRAGLDWGLRRSVWRPVELTSRRSASEIPEVLAKLEVGYPPADERRSPRPIDTLLATNMMSVGIDVDRLGLMLVIGQPKTTSEYIQATSRVGRKTPGLVVTLYNPGKPRDRSHYERFRTYHQSFYRYVEPTSVTPFSLPVLERALRALLIIGARQVGTVADPADFRKDQEAVCRLRDFLIERVRRRDHEHLPAMASLFDAAAGDWERNQPQMWGTWRPSTDDPQPLMYPAGEQPLDEWSDVAWSVPSSMRNVDVECIAEVIRTPMDDEGTA